MANYGEVKGRGKKSIDKRCHVVSLRVTESERKVLKSLAKKKKCTVSALVYQFTYNSINTERAAQELP